MATSLNKVLKQIHHLLAPPGGDQTDGELLSRFVATRDEASFAALVRRHGPMVLSVCRRMLRHDQDAEDCFQATFMVLARKAGTVKRESVGSWLYAVAYRTSLEARAINARRRTREKQVHEMPQPEVMPPEVQDWRPWLDQELNRLPENYRSVIVACDLEGRSRKEAARQLGIAEGTLSSRLARGRRLLAKRLAPHGLSLSGAALAAAICEGAASAQVPTALVSTTTKTAVLVAAGEFAAVSASSAILMKGVLKSMFVTKLKLMVSLMMVVTVLGTSGLIYRASGQSAAPVQKPSDSKPRSELERLRHENELLKLNLEVVLEKVRAQEAEVRALRAKYEPASIGPDGKKIVTDIVIDRIKPEKFQFEWTLEKPRNKEELQQAIDALEKALKGLREQLKEKAVPQKGKAQGEESRPDQSQLEKARKLLEELRKLSDLQKAQSDSLMWQERSVWSEKMSQPGRQYVTVSQAQADEARYRSAIIAEAEAALRVLRETRDSESQRKATDALEKALKQLRQQGGRIEKPNNNKGR